MPTVSTARSLEEAKACPTVASLVRRFHQPARRRIWQMVGASPRFRDLLESFPAAVIAVSWRPRDDPARVEAVGQILAGESLASIARTLELPYWFRRLPPEAFCGPPPRVAQGRGTDAAFGAKVLNHLPEHPAAIAGWLETVMAARFAGGDEFAVWMASQPLLRTLRRARLPVLVLAMYAWHSRHSGEAGRMITEPWRANMSLARAAKSARHWLLSVLQERCLCELASASGVDRTWQVDGFELVPLATPDTIVAEGRAMRNCLAQYVGTVAWGHCRLYGIRREGRRVATLEVRPDDATGAPQLYQLRGPLNAAPAVEVTAAVQTWMSRERHDLQRAFRPQFDRSSEEVFVRLVWAPFVLAADLAGRPVARIAAPAIAEVLREADCLGIFAQ